MMITHEPDIAKHAHRTLHIRDGRLMDEFGNFINPVDEEETVDTVGDRACALPARNRIGKEASCAETAAAEARQTENWKQNAK